MNLNNDLVKLCYKANGNPREDITSSPLFAVNFIQHNDSSLVCRACALILTVHMTTETICLLFIF